LAVFVQGGNAARIANLAGLELRHAVRQITVNTAWSEISRVHACAGNGFIHVKERLALTEGIDQDRGRTAIVRVRAQPHEVIEQARDLGKHHTDVLRALGDFQAEHALDGQAVGVLVTHHRNVIETIHVRQRLDVGLRLGQLFCGAMQQSNMGIGALYHLTVHLEDQA